MRFLLIFVMWAASAHALAAPDCNFTGSVTVGDSDDRPACILADYTPVTVNPGQQFVKYIPFGFGGCDGAFGTETASMPGGSVSINGDFVTFTAPVTPGSYTASVTCTNSVSKVNAFGVTVTGASQSGLMAWVDPLPENPCDAAVDGGATCGDGTLHCPTSVAEARAVIQNAANAGDVVAFRGEAGGGPTGGIYVSSGGTTPMFNVAASGMKLCPYPGEVVKLHGRDAATTEADWNAGLNPDSNHVGILISDAFDDVTIQGFDELAWFGEAAISAGGDRTRIVDNRFGSNYRRTIQIGEGDCCGAGSVSTNDVYIAFNRSFNTVDFTWLALSVDNSTTHRTDRMRVRHNIAINGGREPDGDIAPGGGGNADMYGGTKNCADNGPPNKCEDWDISWNIGYNATDGAFDGSLGNFTAIGNLFFTPGPVGSAVVGWKQLRATDGNKVVAANIVHGANRMGNALELRMTAGQPATVANNLWSFGSGNIGYGDPASGHIKNNVAYLAGNMASFGSAATSNNWTTGNPNLTNLVSDYVPPILALMQNDALDARTRFIQAYSTIATDHEPAPGSPLIDAGVVISGLHCVTADDDPQNPADPAASCLHWLGSAPDQGPIEAGLY